MISSIPFGPGAARSILTGIFVLCTCCLLTACGGAPKAVAPTAFMQTLEHSAVTFEMVGVPAGTVMMNDGTEVAIGAFLISPVEATWDMYDVYASRLDRHASLESSEADSMTRPSKPYLPPDRGYGHAGYPAISISHLGATSYCEWLTLKTGRTYRLATEAEWRYVCQRGGITPEQVETSAWHLDNADFVSHPVGSKNPDANGIYDMYGNVLEWCDALDGTPIAMGGCFLDNIDDLGCAARQPQSPKWNETDPQEPKGRWWLSDADFIGFRIVCEP